MKLVWDAIVLNYSFRLLDHLSLYWDPFFNVFRHLIEDFCIQGPNRITIHFRSFSWPKNGSCRTVFNIRKHCFQFVGTCFLNSYYKNFFRHIITGIFLKF
eukprot:NODE_10_length_61504_cov_0.956502.p59 type:complete len:100 gc:universal NODE_10_length_61504_cov_0.956502:18535-18236(-)